MPDTTVGAIITRFHNGTEEILLTRRAVEPFRGLWCLPGGHVDRYESARDAVIREVKEETGLDFDAHFFDYFDEALPQHHVHNVVLMFRGTATGALSANAAEVSQIDWFPLSNAMKLALAFVHNAVLESYARRKTDPP